LCVLCRWGGRGHDVAGIPAVFGFDWFFAQRWQIRRVLTHLVRRILARLGLGLERLQRAQRAPKLGHGRAAVAQQRVERARPVAVAHQGEPEPAPAALAALGRR